MNEGIPYVIIPQDLKFEATVTTSTNHENIQNLSPAGYQYNCPKCPCIVDIPVVQLEKGNLGPVNPNDSII
jgi:hypothetical protein